MTSVPTGKCGPCCSIAASGSTAIHRAGAAPETSGQWMSVQSRGGRAEVIERNVFLDEFAGTLESLRRTQTNGRLAEFQDPFSFTQNILNEVQINRPQNTKITMQPL